VDSLATPPLLDQLLRATGPSGYEGPASEVWREAASFAEVSTDGIGSSIARIGDGRSPLLGIFGHIDEIGLIVTHIEDDGYLWFNLIGGWDTQVLVGQRVVIQGRSGAVPGLIGPRPINKVAGTPQAKQVVELDELTIDIGASGREQAEALVRVGDSAVIAVEPLRMMGNRLVSRAFDNRIGAYLALESLRRCHESGGLADASMAAVATVQEEIGLIGAGTSAYQLKPDIAIAVDGWFAPDPGGTSREVGHHPLGSGPVIGRGSMLSPKVSELLIETAEDEGIEHTVSGFGMSRHAIGLSSLTDADAIQASRAGIPAGVVSVPLRYIHSPVEMVDLEDLEAAVKLLVVFASRLGPGIDLSR
jgi:putative aminopeptidase FrvX